MKIKSYGNVRPRNTLNHSSPRAKALATYTSRGHNVSDGSNKRQKTSHAFLDDAADDKPDDQWFNRGLQDQSSTGIRRQPSVISVNSQENHSQRSNLFGHEESRDAHGRLNNTKKKGRKPKIGTAQQSLPRQHGASTNPLSVDDDDDDDDVREPDEQHNAPRSAYHRASQWTPSSPPLAQLFKRDDSTPDLIQENRQPPSKIRSKMQSASNTSRTMQPPSVVEELSEDELSREPAVQVSARKIKNTVRSPSPNAIRSTYFTAPNGRQKAEDESSLIIHLSSLRMMGGNWSDLDLIYSWKNGCIQFTKNGDMLCDKGVKIQVSSKHATTVFYSLKSSKTVILKGCTGDFSRGRIRFDFDTADHRDSFLEAIKDMSPKAQFKDLDS